MESTYYTLIPCSIFWTEVTYTGNVSGNGGSQTRLNSISKFSLLNAGACYTILQQTMKCMEFWMLSLSGQ